MTSQFEPNVKSNERERIIFETIKDNPDLHHNRLIALLVPKYMAKTTFEKAISSLEIIIKEISEKGEAVVLAKYQELDEKDNG